MADEKIIGVITGTGPFAGINLLNEIAEHTLAEKDQDHLTLASLSQPCQISDRTEYLLGQNDTNPAHAIVDQLRRLEKMGARIAGIACNTSHAPAIFNVIVDRLRASNSTVKLLHMIEELAKYLREYHDQIQRVGILSTTGTYKSRVYPKTLEPAGFTVIQPNPILQEQVIHRAIYHPDDGIKACGSAAKVARKSLIEGIRHLRDIGAEAVVLGCTDISLVIREKNIDGVVIIDPTIILARALIREADSAKLKPLIDNRLLSPQRAQSYAV